MKKSRYILEFLIIGILIIFPFFTHSRGPAVEPVLGLSIDSMKVVTPKNAKGFDFSHTIAPSYQQKGKNKKKSMTLSKNYFIEKSDSFNNPGILLFIFMFIPFAIWISILKNLKIEDEKEVDLSILMSNETDPTFSENTVSLEQFRKEKSLKNTDDISKKAS